jgi:hypothetical protein
MAASKPKSNSKPVPLGGVKKPASKPVPLGGVKKPAAKKPPSYNDSLNKGATSIKGFAYGKKTQ